MLSKLRHVLDIKTLRSVYYSVLESHLCYASLVWAQNTDSIERLNLLQKKALRVMFFQIEIPIQVLYLKCPIFLSPVIRHPFYQQIIKRIITFYLQ